MTTRERFRAVIEDWRVRYELTPAEAAVLTVAVDDSTCHAAIAEKRGVKQDTIKSQSASICSKSGTRTLADAVIMVLKEVVHGQAA